MLTLPRALCLGLASALVAAGSGCVVPVAAGAAAGYGSYEYVNGEVQYSVYANVEKTRRAMEAVLKDKGWEVKEHTADITSAFFRCRVPDNTQVDIHIDRRSADFTKVTVRYGAFGDENESKQLIEQVKAKL